MKKKIAAIFMITVLILTVLTVYVSATDSNGAIPLDSSTEQVQENTEEQTTTTTTTSESTNTTADLRNDATVSLVDMKDKALETLEDYQESYGDATYGLVAYILNIIRLYSIPFGFVGIAISGIYRYVIGIRKLDVRDKGFGAMIGIITVMVICQVLPLVFAIVVKGWRG